MRHRAAAFAAGAAAFLIVRFPTAHFLTARGIPPAEAAYFSLALAALAECLWLPLAAILLATREPPAGLLPAAAGAALAAILSGLGTAPPAEILLAQALAAGAALCAGGLARLAWRCGLDPAAARTLSCVALLFCLTLPWFARPFADRLPPESRSTAASLAFRLSPPACLPGALERFPFATLGRMYRIGFGATSPVPAAGPVAVFWLALGAIFLLAAAAVGPETEIPPPA